MPQIDVKAEGPENVRVTIGVATSVVLTQAEARKLVEDLGKVLVSGPTEEHLRRVGAL